MAVTPEVEKKPQEIPEGVTEVIDTPEIPERMEKGGVKVTPTQFTAQVTDDQGQPMITHVAAKTVAIPASTSTLEDLSKGSPAASITWLARFWLRMIKKAIHFGWKIVSKVPKKKTNSSDGGS